MSRRGAYLELVRSDAGWFARVRGANGHRVWQSEVYTRKEAALNAFRVLGDIFGVAPARVNDAVLSVRTFVGGQSVGVLTVPLRYSNERTARHPPLGPRRHLRCQRRRARGAEADRAEAVVRALWAWVRSLRESVPDWIGPRIDLAAQWTNDTGEEES